jgi:hypothetical protein
MKKKNFCAHYQFKQLIVLCTLLMTTLGFSQSNKCVIYFKESTKVEGLGKFKAEGIIKFRLNEDSEKVFYDPKLIDRIEMNEGETKLFRYKKIDEFYSQWLEQLVEGKVCLYTTSSTMYSPGIATGGMGGGFGGMTIGGGSNTTTYYYVNYLGEDEVFRIATYGNFSKRFKKTAAEFFKDCPVIVEKVENGTYKKDDLEEIVKFYNTSDCIPSKKVESPKPKTETTSFWH